MSGGSGTGTPAVSAAPTSKGGGLVRVTAPDPILTLTEAKAHLRVDFADDDVLIAALVQAATDTIDGAQGWLGRALGPQTWDWTLDSWHVWEARGLIRHSYARQTGRYWRGEFMDIPLGPLISVDDIEYRNTLGVLTAYTAFDVFGLNSTELGNIRPNVNTTWPDVGDGGDALRIRFTAGYQVESGDSPGVMVPAVPAAIKAAIMLMVGDLYAFRETAVEGTRGTVIAAPMSTTVESLLQPYRIWRP